MKKILIIRPNHYTSNDSLVSDLKSNGYEVCCLEFLHGIEKRDYLYRLIARLGFSIDKVIHRRRLQFNTYVLSVFDKFRPNIVLVNQGMQLTIDTVLTMNKSSVTILNLSDVMSICFYQKNVIPYYDIVMSFDKADADDLRNNGINALWKPAIYSLNDYYPIECDKIYDVCFVGAMYPDRRILLDKLIKDLPDIRWIIYGEYAPIRFPIRYLKFILSDKKKYYKNINIPTGMVNDVYNQSKIVLNIVRNNQRFGWSARLPQILGTKSMQITNVIPGIDECFGDCLRIFTDYEDLVVQIKYYLNNEDERSRIANNGYREVIEKYTSYNMVQLIEQQCRLFQGK